jgi:hypothetical protein
VCRESERVCGACSTLRVDELLVGVIDGDDVDVEVEDLLRPRTNAIACRTSPIGRPSAWSFATRTDRR